MIPPEISVLVAAYNRAHTLRRCIDSILMQTFPLKEIIVVDDGSTDGTAQLTAAYGDAIVYRRVERQGPSRARNTALALSRGRWVAFLDSDDYYLDPDVLAAHLQRFADEPALDAVSAGWRIVDRNGGPLADVRPWEQAAVFDLESFLMWKPAYLGAKMFRREILERVGGLDPSFEAAVDTDLILRILLAGGKFGWLRRIVYAYRQSPDAMMVNAPRQAKYLRMAIDRTFAAEGLPAAVRAIQDDVIYATEIWLAWYLRSRGFSGQAADALARARPHHRERPFVQLKNWWREFLRYASAGGIPSIRPEEFLDVSLPTFSLAEEPQRLLQSAFTWWLRVWGFYAGDADRPAADPPSLRGPSARALVKSAQLCLSTEAIPLPPEVVDRFWRDALAQGAAAPSERTMVVTLYLTGFVRAVYAKQPRAAAAYLGKALMASRSPAAAGPWLRFFHSALAYWKPGNKRHVEEDTV
jgi:glycosyltransferase involved in cell wall biosynthesis